MFDSAHVNGRPSFAVRIATAVLTAALVVATATVASAQSGNATSKKEALVGSWLETVTFPPETERPPLKSLGTFHDDGTMACSDQGGVTTAPPSVVTSCHGVWAHLQGREFAYTSLALISDLSGNLVAYLKVRGVYTVSESGNEYTGTSFAEVVDGEGTVLYSVEVTNAADRILVELP